MPNNASKPKFCCSESGNVLGASIVDARIPLCSAGMQGLRKCRRWLTPTCRVPGGPTMAPSPPLRRGGSVRFHATRFRREAGQSRRFRRRTHGATRGRGEGRCRGSIQQGFPMPVVHTISVKTGGLRRGGATSPISCRTQGRLDLELAPWQERCRIRLVLSWSAELVHIYATSQGFAGNKQDEACLLQLCSVCPMPVVRPAQEFEELWQVTATRVGRHLKISEKDFLKS